MPNIFDRARFRSPGFSKFENSESFKGSIPIGRNIPVYWNELYAGDEIDINIAQITKFLPVLSPIFHRFQVDFIPAFVPFRLLDDNNLWNSQDFFNPATPDEERPAVPMVYPLQLYKGIDKIIGSVWDYLQYPTYTWILQRIIEDKYRINNSVGTQVHFADLLVLYPIPANTDYTIIIDQNLDITAKVKNLYTYYTQRYASSNPTFQKYVNSGGDESVFWEAVFQSSGLKQDAAVNRYINYLHLSAVEGYLDGANMYQERCLSLLPWLCYRVLMDDWFKNTNLQDVDNDLVELRGLVFDLTDSTDSILECGFRIFDTVDANGNYTADCDAALWQSDYFTSAFPNPQSGDAVPIPANGTIPDLRVASRLQKMKEKVIYGGKRLIDQIFVHRGVRSSDARNHRCEILGHKVFNLRVDDVLQTSSSEIDSSLADYAGFVQSASGDHLCHYRSEEAGLIMVICRVRPKTEYIEATKRFLLKSDFYDFENPDFDNVGMQPVLQNEIQFEGLGTHRVFGWQRRYSEYMFGLSHIHADLKLSMDYWHSARQIRTSPALNAEFITMHNDKDNFNRIFAVPGNERPVVQFIQFDVQVTRPLSRYVDFSF